jgi:hypothetical protein
LAGWLALRQREGQFEFGSADLVTLETRKVIETWWINEVSRGNIVLVVRITTLSEEDNSIEV